MTPKAYFVTPNRKRRLATGSISESLKPRKIGKNVKGLKIIIRPESLRMPQTTKPRLHGPFTRCHQKAESAPVHQFEFYFNSVFNNREEIVSLEPSKTNDLVTQQTANFSELVQNLPTSIKTTDKSMTTTGLCTLFSSIL